MLRDFIAIFLDYCGNLVDEILKGKWAPREETVVATSGKNAIRVNNKLNGTVPHTSNK